MGNSKAKENWLKMYQEYADRLMLFARRQVNSQRDAEDLLQDVLMSAWEHLEAGRSIQPAWLFSKIRFKSIDYARQDLRRKKREEDYTEIHEPLFEPNPALGPDEKQLLESAINNLPMEQSDVLMLKLWGELTFEEISGILDCSANTAASRYRYAIENLRKQLEGVLP